MNKQKKDKLIIVGSVVLAALLLVTGLGTAYDKGLYDGMKMFCKGEIKINSDYEYICDNGGEDLWYLNTTFQI